MTEHISNPDPAIYYKCCNTCTFLLGNRSNTHSWETWKCAAPENLNEKRLNLISGEKEIVYIHNLALMARNNVGGGCGIEGKWYKRYEKPDFSEQVLKIIGATPRKPSLKNITADDL
jgi:hypothetical protein